MMQKTQKIASIYQKLQQQMCRQLEKGDGKATFLEVPWSKELGSGLTCVMKNGNVIEKAGLNFSHVEGEFTPKMEAILGMKAKRYSATGISSIIHPNNPLIPIIHMNVRFFELDNGTCWFGGGIDLTPHYIHKEEAQWFHQTLFDICNKYDDSFYPKYKAWADDYFYLNHRNETRGVGGIFFDRVQPENDTKLDEFLNFTMDLASAYPNIYYDIMDKKRDLKFTPAQKQWQNIRRGRYVEFNLIHDRGTKFGLESGGNTESILVSMPPLAEWEYDYQPEKGSTEYETQQLLKKGINWLNISK
ncbi:oxygen-dependent coproporphyrinogen oxidase [Labilibacter sediminis]|nr:oxygen-dependent coproporphyrinogen oxidase [Labilibacter sediminis]